MQIKHNNNGNYENLYPMTLSENVEMNSGKNVEEWKKDVDKDLADMEDKLQDASQLIKKETKALWEGENIAKGNFTAKPSKKISDCFTGWIFVFKKEDSNQQFQYYHVPKQHITLSGTGSQGVKMILSTKGENTIHKYIYVHDTEAKGHDNNGTGEDDLILIRIYEY